MCSPSTSLSHIFKYKDTCEPYEISLSKGSFFIELWGAQGGNSGVGGRPGYGGYTSGVLTLSKPETFLLIVGGKGQNTSKTDASTNSCNGGGAGGTSSSFSIGAGGGGATDLRVSFSLDSRIMVAGGCGHKYSGGDAGGLVGKDGSSYNKTFLSSGATQTDGFQLGVGQDGRPGYLSSNLGAEGGGGAGGGYYGGKTSQIIGVYSNSGGGGGI